jgi:polysaccharide export outer membrane protein
MDKSPKKKKQNRLQSRGGSLSPQVFAVLVVAVLAFAGLARAQEPVSVASAGNTAVTVSSTYTLSPYDVINVSVYGEDDLRTQARLGSDGTVLLPLIGAIDIGGKTVAEANDLIRKRYADGFVKDPHILLTVLEYRKSTFSILGEVTKPGIYEIPEGTHMSIVDAILLAGGFTHLANQNGVKVKRMVKGKPVVFKVKAGAMADSADVAPFDIEPGDVIKVSESWW